MSNRNDPIPGSVGLFGLAPDSDPYAARWAYPCGLCNAQIVSDPGAVCPSCAGPRRKSPRRTRKSTARKTVVKKTTGPKSAGGAA